MVVIAGEDRPWHCPIDSDTLGGVAQFPVGGYLALYTRASDIHTVDPGDSDAWGLTAVLSYVDIDFTVDAFGTGSVNIEFFVETNMGTDIGHVASAAFATGTHTVSIPVSPMPVGEHLRRLYLKMTVGNAGTQLTAIRTDGCVPAPVVLTVSKPNYITVTAPAPAPSPSIGTLMNVLPISRLIKVSVDLTPAGAQAQNLSTLLILGTSTVIDTAERMREYSTLEQVALDFGSVAPEYLAALLWFEQVPQPTTLSIGRMVATASQGGLRGAVLNTADQGIASWNAITNGTFNYTKDGGSPVAVTGLNFSAAANLNAVAAILTGAMTGVTAVWNPAYGRFEFTSTTTGPTSAVGYLTAQGTGTDVSAKLKLSASSSGAYLFTGQAAETAIDAVQAFSEAFGRKWYALVCLPAVNADHLQIAAYLEGTNTKHVYGVTTQEGALLNPIDTTNIAYQLKQLAYKKTIVQYSSTNPYAVISALARQLTVDYNGQNTVITLMYKQEPGIVAENLNTAQANSIVGFNANVFAAFDNDTAILLPAVTSSGIFVDTVIGCDSMLLTLQTDLWNLLYSVTTKVPQTNAGTHLMVTTIENRLAAYVADGLLAPGVWNANGFGALQTGQYLPKGFYVFAPNVDTQNQADRAARRSVPIQVAAKLAGAVHEISVAVTVNQ